MLPVRPPVRPDDHPVETGIGRGEHERAVSRGTNGGERFARCCRIGVELGAGAGGAGRLDAAGDADRLRPGRHGEKLKEQDERGDRDLAHWSLAVLGEFYSGSSTTWASVVPPGVT